MLFTHPDFDQHERLLLGHDPSTGLKAIIAIHNSYRGPALGGCRMYPYPNDEAALKDVLRLSRGMTYKAAMADLPLGGGKAVIIGDPRRHKHSALWRAMGRLVEELGGRYITAEDAGTTVSDLREIARETRHVVGVRPRPDIDGRPGTGDPSPATAYGVYVGIKAALAHRFGCTDLCGLRVAIQGLGNVGWKLAARLHADGVRLWVTDLERTRVSEAQRRFGASAVDPEQIVAIEAEVFAPCALGGILNEHTIPKLRAAVVAGSANNQLDQPRDAERLHQAGVLYAPDYVINAGGLIDVGYERLGVDAPERRRAHIERIGATLEQIFEQAERLDLPTQTVADRMAEQRFGRRQSLVA